MQVSVLMVDFARNWSGLANCMLDASVRQSLKAHSAKFHWGAKTNRAMASRVVASKVYFSVRCIFLLMEIALPTSMIAFPSNMSFQLHAQA